MTYPNNKHPVVNQSTQLPYNYSRFEYYKSTLEYKHNLAISYVIADLLQYNSYLVLNANYGTLSEVLFRLNKKVITSDNNEDNLELLPKEVNNDFWKINFYKPPINFGLFDNIVSIDFTDFYDETSLINFINFTTKQSNRFICLLFKESFFPKQLYIDKYKEQNFLYNFEMSEHLRQYYYTNTILEEKLQSSYVFENLYPIEEDWG